MTHKQMLKLALRGSLRMMLHWHFWIVWLVVTLAVYTLIGGSMR